MREQCHGVGRQSRVSMLHVCLFSGEAKQNAKRAQQSHACSGRGATARASGAGEFPLARVWMSIAMEIVSLIWQSRRWISADRRTKRMEFSRTCGRWVKRILMV